MKFSAKSKVSASKSATSPSPKPLAAINMDIKTFGDPRTFAINYRPNYEGKTEEAKASLAYCHLIVDNRLIGYYTEVCYLSTWFYSLTTNREFIEKNKNDLYPKKFENLNDREIFESILKTNQSEEDFYNDFLYLSQLDSKIWYKHSFRLDETIDGYLFYYYVKDSQITFLIEDRLDGDDRNSRSYNFIIHSVDLDFFFQTIDRTTSFLSNTYSYLK